MKILSLGEILWDTYPDKKTLGGAPLNLAAHAARAGAEAYLLSAVGKDEHGREAICAVTRTGVNSEFIYTVSKKTGECRVSLSPSGVPSYRILEDTAYDFIPFPENLTQFDALCFGTLALRGESNRTLVARLLDSGCFNKIYCDLNLRAPFFSVDTVRFCLERTNILKLSDEELPIVCKMLECKENSDELLSRYPNIQIIILTCGEKGAYAFTRDESFFQPAIKTKVVSTVGAGDSFGATFLVNYLKGEDIPSCLLAGARRSAFVVAHLGAIPD